MERKFNLTEQEKELIEEYVKTFKSIGKFTKLKCRTIRDLYNIMTDNKDTITFIESVNKILDKKAILNKSLETQLINLEEKFNISNIKDFKFSGRITLDRSSNMEIDIEDYLTLCILKC